MGKIVVKTSEEIRREWPPERVRAVLDKARSFPDDITDEDYATGRVRRIGRGFAVIEEIMRGEHDEVLKPRAKKAAAGIRLPEPAVV